DLDTLWWELVSRFQGVTPPDGRSAPDWAAKIHIAVSGLLPHLSLRGDRGARDRSGRDRRPSRRRCAPGGAALRIRTVGSLGSPRRRGDGLAPVRRVSRARSRRSMSDVAALVHEETAAEEERKTSYLELFFDLVFVFAFTQVTS